MLKRLRLVTGAPGNTGHRLYHSAIGKISDDYTDPLRVAAVNIFDRFTSLGYWANSEEINSEPDGFTFIDDQS